MQVKNAASEASAKSQTILIHESRTAPPMTSNANTSIVDYPSEWHTTGTVTPVGKITEKVSRLTSHLLSTKK